MVQVAKLCHWQHHYYSLVAWWSMKLCFTVVGQAQWGGDGGTDLWQSGISGHGASSLISQWGRTIKSSWMHAVTSRYLSWYDLRCFQDVILQQATYIVYIYVVRVTKMGNIASRVVIGPTTLAFWASVLTITTPRLLDVTIVPTPICLCIFLPERSVQTTTYIYISLSL